MQNTSLTKISLQRDIRVLSKRRDWLVQRVRESDKELTYDKAEAKALTEVIKVLDYLLSHPWEIPKV